MSMRAADVIWKPCGSTEFYEAVPKVDAGGGTKISLTDYIKPGPTGRELDVWNNEPWRSES